MYSAHEEDALYHAGVAFACSDLKLMLMRLRESAHGDTRDMLDLLLDHIDKLRKASTAVSQEI